MTKDMNSAPTGILRPESFATLGSLVAVPGLVVCQTAICVAFGRVLNARLLIALPLAMQLM